MTRKNNIIDNERYMEMFGEFPREIKEMEEVCRARLECELPCRRCIYFDTCTKYEKEMYLMKVEKEMYLNKHNNKRRNKK